MNVHMFQSFDVGDWIDVLVQVNIQALFKFWNDVVVLEVLFIKGQLSNR